LEEAEGSDVPPFDADPDFGLIGAARLPQLNVRRHPPTTFLRGVNIYQVDSETGYDSELGLATQDSTLVQWFRVLEAAEGRNHSLVLIQIVKRLSLSSPTNPADGVNSQPLSVSSLTDHMILAVHPFGYHRLLKYFVSPKYIEIRSRVHQFVVAKSGPLMKNFDQKNFVTIFQKYPASQMMLVVKTMPYNIGGVGERHHCLINLLEFVKYSWNLESVADFTDYMHLPVNALLALWKKSL
jgi:hypothetical protein